ncbi:MAG TPA: glycine oxidase ThiO, partial [Herpetosiphonaceae bacterium]
AAGMLAAQAEAEPSAPRLLELLLDSQAAWPRFAAELEAAAGMAIDYRTEGTLLLALDRDDAERLRWRHGVQRRLGLDTELISGAEARALEPHLSPAVTAALLSPRDHQVDNRKLAEALRRAFAAAGGVLRERTPARELLVERGRARGVRLDGETLAAETVILAGGAWSRLLPGLPEAALPPVRPVKGQMLAVRMPEIPLLSRVAWAPEAYLVPRADGRLLIGATVEEQGFDTALTAGGLRKLLAGAWAALPGVDECPVVETWAGLRPASRDNAPLLGPTAVDGLLLACGHYRNGILLAPATAEALAGMVLEGRTDDLIAHFAPRRFAPAAAARQ